MKFKLHAGSTIDTLTPDELGDHLDRQTRNWFQEAARGVSTAAIDAIAMVSGGKILFPATGDAEIGPNPGFMWMITRLTVGGLATNDTLSVYKGFGDASVIDQPTNFIDIITATKPSIYPGKGIILRGEQRLAIAGTGLSATGALVLTGEAFEVGELDAYKLLE